MQYNLTEKKTINLYRKFKGGCANAKSVSQPSRIASRNTAFFAVVKINIYASHDDGPNTDGRLKLGLKKSFFSAITRSLSRFERGLFKTNNVDDFM